MIQPLCRGPTVGRGAFIPQVTLQYIKKGECCAEFAWKGCKLAASGDFETITFADEPERQPGFLIKATEVEFLSPRRVEESAVSMPADGMDEAAA